MIIWQADFYKASLPSPALGSIWQLIVCDQLGNLVYENHCSQSSVHADWLTEHLQRAGSSPDLIQVFRPQCANLFRLAGENLGWPVVLTRHVSALKRLLQTRHISIALDKPPPQALPETLWGMEWRFAGFQAGDLMEFFNDRPIPIHSIPSAFSPLSLGLAETTSIPGVVIDGGRKSLSLARWLAESVPVSIEHIPTEVDRSGGLVLESGLIDRWILLTYEDTEVARAARLYRERQRDSQGLHFLLIQPDDSGRTFTGFWLLRQEEETDSRPQQTENAR
jgi:hypothetical protein